MGRLKKKNYDWLNIDAYINEEFKFGGYAKTLTFSKKSYYTGSGWGGWSNFWYDKQPIQFLKDGKYLIEAIYSYYKYDDDADPPTYPKILDKQKEIVSLKRNWYNDDDDYYFDVKETSFFTLNEPDIKNIKEQKNAHNKKFNVKNNILYYNNTPMFEIIKDKYATEYSTSFTNANRQTHKSCSGEGDNKSCTTYFDNYTFEYVLYKNANFVIDNDKLLVNNRCNIVHDNGYYGGFTPYKIDYFIIPYISPVLIGVEVKNGVAKIIKLKDYSVNNIDYIFNTDLNINSQKIPYNIDTINATLLINEKHTSYPISENPIVSTKNNVVDLTFAKQVYSYDGFGNYNDWLDMLLMQLCVYKLD